MKTATLAIGCLFASLSVHAVGITGQGTWEASLQARDLDGNMATIEAYYDTALGITWLADANAAAGTAFDGGGSPTDGRMTWSNANAWAASLSLGGFSEWRLPIATQPFSCSYSAQGYDFGCTGTELGHMYYYVLGNLPEPSNSGLINTGPFTNLVPESYWFATMMDMVTAYRFDFGVGGLDETGVDENMNFPHAWAVHDGDIGTSLVASAVPLPAGFWLLGSGVLGLVGVLRKQSVC